MLVAVATKKGTDDDKLRKQLASLCLNLGTENLCPENGKCQLGLGNEIDDNTCGMGITIGEALQNVIDRVPSTDEAKNCADELNNDQGIVTP